MGRKCEIEVHKNNPLNIQVASSHKHSLIILSGRSESTIIRSSIELDLVPYSGEGIIFRQLLEEPGPYDRNQQFIELSLKDAHLQVCCSTNGEVKIILGKTIPLNLGSWHHVKFQKY